MEHRISYDGASCQWFRFSRNIGWVTPKIINFSLYMLKHFSGTKYPLNSLFNYENRNTARTTAFGSSIRYNDAFFVDVLFSLPERYVIFFIQDNLYIKSECVRLFLVVSKTPVRCSDFVYKIKLTSLGII